VIANIPRAILGLSVVLTRAVVEHLSCLKTVLVTATAGIRSWQALLSRIVVLLQTAGTRVRGRTTSIDMFGCSMEGQHESCSTTMQVPQPRFRTDDENHILRWAISSVWVRNRTHLRSNSSEGVPLKGGYISELYFLSRLYKESPPATRYRFEIDRLPPSLR